MAKVIKINATIKKETLQPLNKLKKRRVAAYARVSTDSDEQFTSFEAQVDYYTKYIESNPEWENVGIYTDEGISGTQTKYRKGFQKMIEDALHGKIDLIVTKSVSRFARNTVDSLTTIRELKAHKVEVFFEKENIYTFDSKGELLITIMSSLAQEESRSISENVTWGVRKGFSDGKFSLGYKRFLGYEKGPDGRPKIVEEEAKIIKEIYGLFLEGYSTRQIADELNLKGCRTASNKGKWNISSVLSILKNEKYKGEAILQKTYTVDFLTHETRRNNGELPQYHVKNSHEAIIPIEEWEMVQVELERRNKLNGKYSFTSIFSTKLICGDCGGYYGQKVWHSTDKYRRCVLQCNKKFSGEIKCKTPAITEQQIKEAFVKSFNEISAKELIDDSLMAIEVLKNTEDLDKEEAELSVEAESLISIAKKMIEDNSTKEQDQEKYRKKYAALVEKHNRVLGRLDTIDKEKRKRLAAIKQIEMSMIAFKKIDEKLDGFNPKLWTMLIEKAIVKSDKTIEFVYYAGYQNTVDIK